MASCRFLRFRIWWLLLLLLLYSCLRVAQTSETYTYMGKESYAEYPRWRTAQDGLAEFAFRTSQADAILFYLDSIISASQDYLALWLDNGRIRARMEAGGTASDGGGPLETVFGEHFNNLHWHSVHIKHFRRKFEFYIDDVLQGNLTYDLDQTFEAGSYVYIGGLPSSHNAHYDAASSIKSLAGCIKDVSFADDSIVPLQMRPKSPLSTNKLSDGCLDGCATSNCNDGVCVKNWGNAGGSFCDCSEATDAGQFCNISSSDNNLVVNGNSYFCYTPLHQPYTSRHGDILVQLQPPLPRTGTITAGHSLDWSNQFNLFIKDSVLHYELTVGENEYFVNSNLNLAIDNIYRISLTNNDNEIEILIRSVSSTNQIAVVETIPLSLTPGEILPEFEVVCVGGGAMEVPIYDGVMERVHVGHVSLLESQQNYSLSSSRQRIETTNVIKFSNESASPPLVFTKHGLHSDNISFQFRLSPDIKNGILLRARDARDGIAQLMITIFSQDSGDVVMTGLSSTGWGVKDCDSIFVTDGDWHHFELTKTGDPTSGESGIVMTIDGISSNSCYLNMTGFSQIIESETSILEFGPTSTNNLQPSVTPLPFLGCFQKFKFVKGTSTFQPNLEVPVMQYDRFYGDGCYDCSLNESRESNCINGGVCQNVAALESTECKCLKEFTGDTCQELTSTTPPPTTSPTSATITTTNTPSPSTPSTSEPTTDPTVETDGQDDNNDDVNYDALGQWVGITTAILLVLILLTILLVFIGCFVHSQRIKGTGFYRTHENTSSVVLPHFSASLKTAHSHTLNLEQNRVTAITNGRTVHPTYASGEKEFYI